MKVDIINPAALRAAGYMALSDKLGPVGMAKFLRQFHPGHGDYTRERHQWLSDQSIHAVAKRIRAQKKNRV